MLGYLVALNIKPVFQSTATLVIESDVKKIVDIEEVYADKPKQVGFGRNFNHINNQIQIMKSDEIFNGVLSNEEKIKKIANLHNNIPDSFVNKNINAIKKLIFFQTKRLYKPVKICQKKIV